MFRPLLGLWFAPCSGCPKAPGGTTNFIGVMHRVRLPWLPLLLSVVRA